MTIEEMRELIKSHKQPDKQFFLDLLDEDKQRAFEQQRVQAVMALLKVYYIDKLKRKIKESAAEAARLRAEDFSAENYRAVIGCNAEIRRCREEIEGYKGFFVEPYFARMDLFDDKEGYNSYYIGKKGDINLEIVDWRAPLARKYYQKSQILFSINDYHYKQILRRALRTQNGRLIDFKNEYLSLRDYLTKEEIAGRDEEIIFDPYLKEILRSRKEQSEISDIIETIQEKQYDIITRPERESFVLQGCAGSGKTMIMLHRLSFLMYNNESLKPSDVLVLTPSDSFNAFIDELSQVLELEKVKTKKIDEYFLQLLQNEGIDIAAAIDDSIPVPQAYLEYIYSEKFYADVEKKLGKIYDGILGMFLGEECRGVAEACAADCRRQLELFAVIKNAGQRLRRAVLGEIKEKPEGGLYYTKPFRSLMNEVTAAEEFLTSDLHGERIRHREQLMAEADKAAGIVREISAAFERFCELFEALRGNQDFVRIGKCGTHIELCRYLYRETVRRVKNKFGIGKGLLRSDPYALCLLFGVLGTRLQPRYGLVFIDEGQDISANEYRLLRQMNEDAAFNIYGDLAQNITRFRGLTDWDKVAAGEVFTLEQNYRNTNQIVSFVARELDIDMQPIGFDGPEVAHIGVRGVNAFFRDKKGLKAVIVSEGELETYRRKSYNVLRDTGRLSKTKINLMTVYESKGLEFTCVAVADARMTRQEKYIAYTRALKELAVIGGERRD